MKKGASQKAASGRAWVLVAAACLPALVAGGAWAAKSDRTRPLSIDAGDGQLVGERTPGRVEVKGPVVVTKGSLLMRAGGVVATERATGYHVLAQATANGHVSFAIDLEEPGARMEAQAEQVEYEESSGVARFVGNARFRRLLGGQVQKELSGNLIVFDTVKEELVADGKPLASRPGDGGLRIVLMPPAGATAPAASAQPASAVPLQTTPALTPKPPSK